MLGVFRDGSGIVEVFDLYGLLEYYWEVFKHE